MSTPEKNEFRGGKNLRGFSRELGVSRTFWRELMNSARSEELDQYNKAFAGLLTNMARLDFGGDTDALHKIHTENGMILVGATSYISRRHHIPANEVRIVVNVISGDPEEEDWTIETAEYAVNPKKKILGHQYGLTEKIKGDLSLKPSYSRPPTIDVAASYRFRMLELQDAPGYVYYSPADWGHQPSLPYVIHQREHVENLALCLEGLNPATTEEPICRGSSIDEDM